ncbi:MAG: TMEM175 family protein [Bacteroidia bacterium]
MIKSRLEAFSDGVIAIIITIMVLELKVPHSAEFSELQPLIPVIISYVFSFLNIGIYWGNHHHLIHAATSVNSKMIWANLHLLFWLSLNPFATAWMGETHFAPMTVAVFATLQLLCGIAYYILLHVVAAGHKENNNMKEVLKRQSAKGMLSVVVYIIAIATAFVHPAISGACFIFVAIIWWIPDRNIEKIMSVND